MRHLLQEYIKEILQEIDLHEKKDRRSRGKSRAPKSSRGKSRAPKSEPAQVEYLLSNQKIGFAAEWAMYNALGGKKQLVPNSDPKGGINDSRIDTAWTSAPIKTREIFIKILEKMTAAARTTIGDRDAFPGGKRELGTPTHPPSTAKESGNKVSATEKVDVPTDKNNFHVKYNDEQRLMGFQKEEAPQEDEAAVTDSPAASMIAEIYFEALREHVTEMRKEYFEDSTLLDELESIEDVEERKKAFAKRTGSLYSSEGERLEKAPKRGLDRRRFDAFVDWGGVLRKRGPSLKKGETPTQKQADFEEVKREYQSLIMSGENRARFMDRLEAQLEGTNREAFSVVLRAEIKAKLGKYNNKPTYFANFVGRPSTITRKNTNKDTAETYNVSLILTNYTKELKLEDGEESFRVIPALIRADQMAAAAKDIGEDLPAPDAFEESGAEDSSPKDAKGKETTTFYRVTDASGSKEWFRIEFRLDGEGHPPQLKSGPALKELLKQKTQAARRG